MKDNFDYGNNNYNFNPYIKYSNQLIRQDNMTTYNNPSINIAKPDEGFIKGNMFNNLYNTYMSYRPIKLVPNNEQAELLLNLDIYKFASHEIRLYLDVYPTDNGMIDLFNQYNERANELVMEYEKKYGPITWSGLSNFNQFSWVNTKWPWEMEEV